MKSLLADNFFTIAEIHYEEDSPEHLKAIININPEHPIFEGHFPDNPIVPGVCIIQMIKETLSQHFCKELIMVTAEEVKFLNIIDPRETAVIHLEYKIKHPGDDLVHCSVLITDSGKTYMKFRGKFK